MASNVIIFFTFHWCTGILLNESICSIIPVEQAIYRMVPILYVFQCSHYIHIHSLLRPNDLLFILCFHISLVFLVFWYIESFQFLCRYFIYTAKDLEEWSENPESFHHEQNLVQWTEKKRPCAEALFIVIFEKYREVCTSAFKCLLCLMNALMLI